MSNFYVACELGAEHGRVMLGSLHQGQLTMSEVRKFQNVPVKEDDSFQWNIPQLYQETVDGLREIGAFQEPIDSISCNSWAADYLLFDSEGALITPAYSHRDPVTESELKKVFSKIPEQDIYDETGVHQNGVNTLFQLRAEKSRRLNKASHLMPVADGFNYLLGGGTPRAETSLASLTQLYNPLAEAWSDRLFDALDLPRKLFPAVVRPGTEVGLLRPDIAKHTGLENVRVVTTCSHELAAALAGLPKAPGENWAFLRQGSWAVMGTELTRPIINEASRKLNFTNGIGCAGSIPFYKHMVGLWILEECQRFWAETERELDGALLVHLATSATPFECLINPADPRFLTPGDMPAKIQAFCKETNQLVPRKPGQIVRCILESLALFYRRTLREIEALTGSQINRLCLLGDSGNSLLNHFIANALQIPIVIAPADATSIGNVMVQAVALGHIKSLDEARETVRHSFKMEAIIPHAAAWNAAYDRLAQHFPF
jgi:rhamnulokinase